MRKTHKPVNAKRESVMTAQLPFGEALSLPSWLRIAGLATVALLAAFLGGSTARWSQGVVLFLIGIAGLAMPPRVALGRGAALCLAGFFALAVASLLPAAWFPTPAWKTEWAELGVVFPLTFSAQPWLTGESLILLLGGIVWFSLVAGRGWNSEERRVLMTFFSAGVVLLAAVALIGFFAKYVLPFWSAPRGLGPFPNRNQTANFFALGSLLTLACARESWSRQRKSFVCWLAGFAVLVAATVLAYSRAGIALLIGGLAAWIAVVFWFTGSRRRLAIGVSVLALVLSGFLLFGGETLARFRSGTGEQKPGLLGFRGQIFSDTLRMTAQSPWHGVGLGNFRAVFPFYREATAGETTFIHPESDWLWMAAEVGWPGVALFLTGLALVLARVFPLAANTSRHLRAAALVAALGFLLHGLVDVSGHRLGTVIPAILVFSLALRSEPGPQVSRWRTAGFRAVSAGLAVVGFVWAFGAWKGWPLPGAAGVAEAKDRASKLAASRQFPAAVQAIAQALPWAPLDWHLYFARGTAKAYQRDLTGALADFRTARRLQPYMTSIPVAEGKVWLTVEPSLALATWEDTLRHVPKDQRPDFYRRLFRLVPSREVFHSALLKLAAGQPSLQAIALRETMPSQQSAALGELLRLDPSLEQLSDREKTPVFRVIEQTWPLEQIEQAFAEHPSWLAAGWKTLARRLAKNQRYEEAVQIALKHLAPPSLPPAPAVLPAVDELQRQVLRNPDDFPNAYFLYLAQSQRGRSEDALDAMERTRGRKARPAYFSFLEAQERVRRKEWSLAWNELARWVL